MANIPGQAKGNFIKGILSAKKGAERGLQAAGRRIGQNEMEGSAAFRSGKMPYYGTINPLRGTLAAFKQGYKNSQ